LTYPNEKIQYFHLPLFEEEKDLLMALLLITLKGYLILYDFMQIYL